MADTGRHANHDRDVIGFTDPIGFLGQVDAFLRIGRLEHGDFGKFGIIPVVLFILSNEKLTQHSFRIKIEIIDFPRLIDQARDLIRQGAKVIITNSGSHQILTKVIDTLPILCLFSSMNDALYTLRSIAPKYKKIHLLLNENFMFNKDACPEELRKKNRLPIYSIRPSESTMLSVLLYAQELLVFQKKDSQQLSMMSSILSHVTDGIILYAKGGAIYHINKRAASFLGIPETTQNMRDIFPNWKEGKKPSFQETILHRPPYTLVANSDYFLTDSAAQYIMTIRDVTELQRLEKNIRYKLSKTGMTAAHHFEDKYPAPEPAISERPA
ncbi:MAG: hypothetical protein MR644_00475 [Megasphaera elsdenii]|nr:hypothetical protein [Megasphaera elsdenii]